MMSDTSDMVVMKVGIVFVILMVRFSPGITINSTNNEIVTFADNMADDDDEQELSMQLHDVETRPNSWTEWSEWSPCSRSCDGGVAHQLRRCQVNGCRGDRIRHKICNMQPCIETNDFRDTQCAAYNNIPYEGALFTWQAHYDDLEPCTLVCRGHLVEAHHHLQGNLSEQSIKYTIEQLDGTMKKLTNFIASHEPGIGGSNAPDGGNDIQQYIVLAKKAHRVQDGTRCRPGSLDMCINGDCQRVGCDLRIGSNKQVDICGICGGDGSSCTRTLYHWNLAPMSLCSATCGGGYKMSHAICQNRATGEDVEGQLCNQSIKPHSAIETCNTHSCPPKWTTEEWSACSMTCGMGQRVRDVHCATESKNTKLKVKDQMCNTYKPKQMEICNQEECPQWNTSAWSGCSASCGQGHQSRTVKCMDHKNNLSTSCNPVTQPTATKPCSIGIQCPFEIEEHLISRDPHGLEQEVLSENNNEVTILAGLYHTQPLMQPYPPPQAERLVGEEVVPSESTFIPEEWGPCSTTCGEGLRRRKVDCKIFLEFSRTIAKLPDKQCPGPKPIEEERCYMEPCSNERIDIKDDPFRQDSTIKVAPGTAGKTYSWQEQGYTHCSATCLGGVQELIVNCIRDDNRKVASPYLCARDLKPEILIRTCNDHPCPPRWNYSDFQPCTQSCGIGIQTREVNCIHEVTQGGGNTVVVPNNMCPQPQPPDRQYCNVLDCPVRWKTSDWTKCSKVCGGGDKTRKVECKQVMAQNHTVDRPIGMCPNPKPPDRKPCNTKSCVSDSDRPHIETSNTTFIQHDPKKKKLTLKVGGAATVFYGAVIKIKCPVKRFNRTKIQWAKDHTYLPHKSKKYKTSKKGALRVQNLTYRDSGIYTCVAGRSSADLALSVRPKPGEFLTSEEIQKQSAYRNDRVDLEVSDKHRESGNPNFDDQSHERRPDASSSSSNKQKLQKIKLFTPTLPSLRLDTNSLNAPQHTTFATSKETDDKTSPTHHSASASGSNKSVFESSAKSTANRNMPQFQMLISNLQLFRNSRDHQMVPNYHPTPLPLTADLLTADNPRNVVVRWRRSALETVRTVLYHSPHQSVSDIGEEIKFGRRNLKKLGIDWIDLESMKCSNTCEEDEYQLILWQCMVDHRNISQRVIKNLCKDVHLRLASSNSSCSCSPTNSPEWMIGNKSSCDDCRLFYTAIQKRKVLYRNFKNCALQNIEHNSYEEVFSKLYNHSQNGLCRDTSKAELVLNYTIRCNGTQVHLRLLKCIWCRTPK